MPDGIYSWRPVWGVPDPHLSTGASGTPLLHIAGSVVQGKTLTFRIDGYDPNMFCNFGFIGLTTGQFTTDQYGSGVYYTTVNLQPGSYIFFVEEANGSNHNESPVTVLAPPQQPSGSPPGNQPGGVYSYLYQGVPPPTTWNRKLVLNFWNPFNYDMKPVAGACLTGISDALNVYNAGANTLGQHTFTVNPQVAWTNNSVTIQIYESGVGIAPIAIAAIVIATAVAFGVLFIGFAWFEQGVAAVKQVETNASMVNQIQSNPNLTQDQKNTALGILFPKGVNTSAGTDAAGGLMGQITTFVPLLLGLAVLGAVVTLIPKRGRD